MAKKSKKKQKRFNLKMSTRFSTRQLVIFALIFGIIGGYFVYRSFAATTVATLEAEQMTLPAKASIIDDSSASGKKAIALTANGSASSPSPISLPSPAASFTLKARAKKCKGVDPQFSVTIDNNKVLTGKTYGSWASYSLTKDFAAGNHSLSISYINDQNTNNCDSTLFLDVITFYGKDTAPPAAPTVTLSASPTSVSAGSSSTLAWNSSNATSCTASGAWSGDKSLSGSASTGAVNSDSIYTLTCSSASGSAKASTTVTVSSGSTQSSSIYWGAYMNGGDTYAYYYGNPAPNGSNWSDAPWSNTGGTWDRFESNAGKKVSILHYGQPNPWNQTTFYGNVADIVTKRGGIPMIDMGSQSTDLNAIARGDYDASIKTWATNVKNWGKPMFLRWNWEMNGPWFGWGAQAQQNPSAFVNSWRHFHDVVAAQGASNVTWVWCPNLEYDGSTKPLSGLYPGDSYVDWTCLDGYNQGSTSQSFSSLYSSSYNTLLNIAPNKPIMIGEVGSLEYGSGVKASWITDMLTNQIPKNFPKIKAVLWFNWRIYENNYYKSWPIESSSATQTAFKNAIANPYYAPNNFGNLPPLTKVKPLP